MKFPTVEKFLCCMRLELGALILGLFGLIWSGVMILFLITLLIWSIFSYGTLMDILPESSFGDLMKSYSPILVKFLILIILSYCAVYFYASRMLVKSLKTRYPNHVHPFMIVSLLDIILSILTVLHFSWISLIVAVIETIINGYIFICVYSLFDFLKDEAIRTRNRHSQYQSAPLTMK